MNGFYLFCALSFAVLSVTFGGDATAAGAAVGFLIISIAEGRRR